MSTKDLQGKPCVADRSADVDLIAWCGACAQQCAGPTPDGDWHLAKHRDRDGQRPLGRVTANQFAAVRLRQSEHPAGEALKERLVCPRQRQREHECRRSGAASRKIAQVDGKRLVAESLGSDRRQEMPPLNKHVARHGQMVARCRGPQGAVVADTLRRAPCRAREVARDQLKFSRAHGRILMLHDGRLPFHFRHALAGTLRVVPDDASYNDGAIRGTDGVHPDRSLRGPKPILRKRQSARAPRAPARLRR